MIADSVVMSVAQVCEQLGCQRRQIFRLLTLGVLERAPRYGRSLRIYTASVLRALQPAPARGRKRRESVREFERINPDDVRI